MTKLGIGTALAVALCMPQVAHAFCGLYLATGDAPRLNDATELVVMRKGSRTVLAMQNSYVGPAEPFAVVVPVPAAVQAKDVTIVDRGVFEAVERLGAPRLVEYWEQDPCASTERAAKPGSADHAAPELGPSAPNVEDPDIIIESQLAAGEYQIAIVAAKDAAGLEAWLRREKYQVPAGAEPLLRGYIERGMKFVVAKVDPKLVAFSGGRAVLSPLRVTYDSEQLVLPIRLGLANSPGTQDLIVNVLAPAQRYEAANYPNVTIPTNIAVTTGARDRFGAFYAALFDATLDRYPDAVVTEYVWDATSCEPCTGPPLSTSQLEALGADVLGDASSFVLTRLHARYGKSIEQDLVLWPASPIAGGRERVVGSGTLERGAHPAPNNRFEARYTIRHGWRGPLTCEHPVRGRWSAKDGSVKPALDLAFAPRGAVELTKLVTHDVPAIDLTVGGDPLAMLPATVPATAPADGGSGCASTTGEASTTLVLGALLVMRRRKRRAG